MLAADSQATFGVGKPQPLRTTEEKLWQVGDAPVVAGISGHVGMAQNVKASLASIPSTELSGRIAKLRPILRNHVVEVLRDAKQSYVPIHQSGGEPICETVIAGYTVGAPWILEINCNGLDEQHEHRGFLALGSGEAFAHFACAAMRHHAVRELGIFHAQVLAFRTIETAIKVAAFGLGPPIQMWTIDDKHGACRVDKDKDTIISHTSEIWKSMETESLVEAVQVQPHDSGASRASASA